MTSGSSLEYSVQMDLTRVIEHNPDARPAAAQALSGSPLEYSVQIDLTNLLARGNHEVRSAAARALER
jgi:HEAT repeat protein